MTLPSFSDHNGAAAPGRLFFALWPPPLVVPAIMACARQAHQVCGGRIMRPETLHLTLAFLGHTSVTMARKLIQEAQQWTVTSGPITLNRIGRFRGPGVVWAGPSPDQPEWLYGLHDALWGRLEGLGWERPDSVFRPHVSLLRNAGPGDGMECAPISWVSGEAVLVASDPRPGGSHYRVLARLPVA